MSSDEKNNFLKIEFSKTFRTRLDVVDVATSDLLKELNKLSLSEDILFHIKLCVQEALINALKHGNKLNENLHVTLKAFLSCEVLDIFVEDQGSGFDHSCIENPAEDKNIEQISGRGIFLIKNYMDQVDFFDGGRGIRMIKFLKKAEKNEYTTRKN